MAFIYFQIWCGSMRPEDALSKVRSSVHSPGPIRFVLLFINGISSDIESNFVQDLQLLDNS